MMKDRWEEARGCRSFSTGEGPAELTTEAIFQQLIEEELRSGNLTRSRRRRLVRYAAHLQMSAVDVGRMISASRARALESDDPQVRRHALRLAPPPPERVPVAWKFLAVVLAALLLDLLLLLMI